MVQDPRDQVRHNAAQDDPRARLIEKQLAYREIAWEDCSTEYARTLDAEIDALIAKHSREWAGRVADLVEDYRFHRGQIAEVDVIGERFLEVAPELFALAPIWHVNLKKPLGSIADIAASPWLARLASLHADALGEAVGDRGAIALAHSPHVANLVHLSLWYDAIGRDGVEALAASPYLRQTPYVGLVGNPADPTPFVTDEGDGEYSSGRPALAVALEEKYGPRPWLAKPTGHLPSWPPRRDDLALMRELVLRELEALAQEVERLEAAADDEESAARASARRRRLLIELDVSGLLAGAPEVRRRVSALPTLLGYHEAAVAMMRYLASDARNRIVAAPIPLRVINAPVSLDWFRKPSAYQPSGVSAHDWLALCERNFLDPMPTGPGTRFVRLEGKMYVLYFRLEVGPQPRLCRAEPA